jgi:hypothetical protein
LTGADGAPHGRITASKAGQPTGGAGGRLIATPVQVVAWPRQRCDCNQETYTIDDFARACSVVVADAALVAEDVFVAGTLACEHSEAVVPAPGDFEQQLRFARQHAGPVASAPSVSSRPASARAAANTKSGGVTPCSAAQATFCRFV